MTKRISRTFFCGTVVASIIAGALIRAQHKQPIDVPYVPTPQNVIEEMLKLAAVTKDDVVYDLGSGDGRIIITAARKYSARGVGVEIDPERVKEANANARQAGVAELVKFVQQDHERLSPDE